MATVSILTGNHICNNPRAFKEASALSDAGFDVHWLGGWFDRDLAARDQDLIAGVRWKFTPVTDWTRRDLFARARRTVQRLRSKAAAVLHATAGRENLYQLGYCGPEMLRDAEALHADLYIAHSESALWSALELHRRGHRVGVDMEDWFSEDLSAEARKQRPVRLLRDLERKLLREARHRSCTSAAMGNALAAAYDCHPPVVVYNAFPWSDRAVCDGQRKDRNGLAPLSLHWFSQTIGPGRGLEDLFGALPHLSRKVEIHLRGAISRDFRVRLLSLVAPDWRPYVTIHPVVKNSELLSRIREHDIGLALDLSEPPSRNVTITNKILQYLQAGLAVAASDTVGHREVAAMAPGALGLYPAGDPIGLAGVLNGLIADAQAVRTAKAAALAAAESRLCWEKCSAPLVASVSEALRQ